MMKLRGCYVVRELAHVIKCTQRSKPRFIKYMQAGCGCASCTSSKSSSGCKCSACSSTALRIASHSEECGCAACMTVIHAVSQICSFFCLIAMVGSLLGLLVLPYQHSYVSLVFIVLLLGRMRLCCLFNLHPSRGKISLIRKYYSLPQITTLTYMFCLFSIWLYILGWMQV